MSADQINELRDSFRRAMLDWDVPVSVNVADDYADVSFPLWGTKFEGCFHLKQSIGSSATITLIMEHQALEYGLVLHLDLS